MDGMALLCNLHADGPETLRSLRDEGCATLHDLDGLDAERLSELVGFSPAAARRFLREGRMLLERLGDPGLEGEEQLGVPAPPVALNDVLSEAQPAASGLPRNEQAILARVLERWHEVDPLGVTETAPAAEALPAPDPPDPDGLRAGSIDGLDESLCGALVAHGIATLSALAECSPEDVTRATGLPFTRARRLQFLARRGAASDVLPALEPAPRHQVRTGEKISLAFPDVPPAPAPAVERESSPAVERESSPVVERESSPAGGERETPAGPFA